MASRRDVSVIVNTCNDAVFLPEALDSVFAQTVPPREVIVVDDGSPIPPAAVVARYAGALLITKENGGLASARNAGLAAATSPFVLFLDADDRLAADALARGLDCLEAHPDCLFAYGAYRSTDGAWRPIDRYLYLPIAGDPFEDLLRRGNFISMHATVLYRREALAGAGGFDEALRRCEDFDVYLRLARKGPVASHPHLVADYRFHGGNMTEDRAAMLAAALAVTDKHRPGPEDSAALHSAWRAGRRFWRRHYATEMARFALRQRSSDGLAVTIRRLGEASAIYPLALARLAARRIVRGLRAARRTTAPPP